jgi:hypothetical protein
MAPIGHRMQPAQQGSKTLIYFFVGIKLAFLPIFRANQQF